MKKNNEMFHFLHSLQVNNSEIGSFQLKLFTFLKLRYLISVTILAIKEKFNCFDRLTLGTLKFAITEYFIKGTGQKVRGDFR